MKKVLFCFILVFFVSCAEKYAINYDTYVPIGIDEVDASNRIYFIKTAIDQRDKKSIIAVINDQHGNTKQAISAQTKIDEWITKAIKTGLKSKNAIVLEKASENSININIYIQKLFAFYNGDKFDKNNLKGEFKIKIVIQKGNLKLEKNIKQSESQYRPLVSVENFEILINELLKDVANRSVNEILELR